MDLQPKYIAFLEWIIQHKGQLQQIIKCGEELCELTQLLNKLAAKHTESDEAFHIGTNVMLGIRASNYLPFIPKIHEEIVDVELLLHQIKSIFGEPPAEFYEQKLNREAERCGYTLN